MMQQDEPGDYVLATGEMHSVREFVELAFGHVGRTLAWRGEGVGEEAVDAASGDVLVSVDPRYFRPNEVDELLGDPRKARDVLGWRHRTSFAELVSEMMAHDLAAMADDERSRRDA
jgi:GDPmannose 4,6-dehydratase